MMELGFKVHLVERSDGFGGPAKLLRSTWQGEPIVDYLNYLIQKVYENI
jgi:hypothetical protein